MVLLERACCRACIAAQELQPCGSCLNAKELERTEGL